MRTIKQTVEFKAQPHEVFEALMDSRKHSEFTGQEAVISREVGGKFTAYDGYIHGKTIKIEPDKLIVQEWWANDWPEGAVSKATFKITKTKAGSRLALSQTGVPDEQAEEIERGWEEFYWEPMRGMLEKTGKP